MLEKTLESHLDCKETKSVNPKGNQPWKFTGWTDAEAEAPKLWPPDVKSWFTGKDPDVGKDWRWEEKGTTEDEIVGRYHQLNKHDLEQALGDGERQGSLACCSPWGCKEFAKTEWLNNKYREWRGESCVSRFKKLWVEEEISVAQSLSYLLPTWCEVRVGGYAK